MNSNRRWQLRQYAEYICAYCGTKKDARIPLLACPNCGSAWVTVQLHDARKPFNLQTSLEGREAPPQ